MSLRAALAPGDEVIVVADNCSDATAVVARSAGATVIERHDPDRRGKGLRSRSGSMRWRATLQTWW